MLYSLTCLALLLGPAADQPPAYPRPELLVEAGDLARPGAAGKVVVLDARARDQYRAGHIPGALWVDHAAWSTAFAEGQDPKAWAGRVGALGINVGTPVVVYDDNRAKDAARIWWVLRFWGVRDVRLLNGGWQAWREAGGQVEEGENKARPVEPRLTAERSRLATKAEVLASLDQRPQVLDARSEEEHCGTTQTARRSGAIPGAVHLEWSDTVEQTGRFKSAAELRRLFREAGVDPSRPTTTYCQSGGRAAVMAFVLELMGGKEVRNYYRSWAEWGNAEDTPVVKPKK